MTLKVLQVASGLHAWGGTEKYILDVSIGLRARGHEIVVACQKGSDTDTRASAAGLPAVYLRTRSQYDWKQFPSFVKALRGQRYDVVHIHGLFDYIVPAAAARWAGVPVVVMTRHLPHPFSNAITAYVCSKLFYDGIIAVSDFIGRVVVSSHVSPDRVVVVKNGIHPIPEFPSGTNQIRQEFDIPRNTFLVAGAGRMIEGKGFDVLIRAMAAARRMGLDATCLIAGTGHKLSELERLVKELGVESNVRLLGFRTDVLAVFAAADVVVVPSSTFLDPFAYTVLEGLGSGRPVIGSRVGGIPELVTPEVGLLVEPGDSEGMARAILDLAKSPGKRLTMGQCARQKAQGYTVDKCVSGIEKVYEVLSRKLPISAARN